MTFKINALCFAESNGRKLNVDPKRILVKKFEIVAKKRDTKWKHCEGAGKLFHENLEEIVLEWVLDRRSKGLHVTKTHSEQQNTVQWNQETEREIRW